MHRTSITWARKWVSWDSCLHFHFFWLFTRHMNVTTERIPKKTACRSHRWRAMSSRHSDQIITGNPWDGYTFPAKLFGEGPSFWDIWSISSCFFPFFWASKDQKDPEMMESPIPQPLPVPHQAWQSAGQRDHLQGGISPRLREEQQRNRFFFGGFLSCAVYQPISTHINPYQPLARARGWWWWMATFALEFCRRFSWEKLFWEARGGALASAAWPR